MTSTSNLDRGGANFSVEGSLLQTEDGLIYDLSTASGVADAEDSLSPAELEELEELMKAQGFALLGARWVPDDVVVGQDEDSERAETLRAIGGVSQGATAETDLDRDLNENVYKPAGVPSPYHPETTSELDRRTRDSEARKEAGALLRTMAGDSVPANGTNPDETQSSLHERTDVRRFQNTMAEFETESQGNVMELLYLVFRDSIKETNEDKKYFLIKLQSYNAIAESLSDYLSELVRDSEDLSNKAIGTEEPDKVTTHVTVKTFDTSTVNAEGKGVVKDEEAKVVTRSGLNDTIKGVEAQQETVRNQRQMTSTAFQNFDQKSNQLYSLLSSVLKTMREARSGAIRNML